MDVLSGLLILVLGGAVTGMVADRKGREFGPWFLFGVLMLIVALPWALLMKEQERGYYP